MDHTADIDHYYEEGEGRQRQDQAELEEMREIERLKRRLDHIKEERDRLEEALRSELDYWTHLSNMPDPKPTGTDARERAEKIDVLLNNLGSNTT